MENLDDPNRIDEIRDLIFKKPGLYSFYERIYQKFKSCLDECPKDGIALELGSGGGFIKDIIPNVVTSDVIPYQGVDKVIDATNIDFPNNSLNAIFMINVLHHIPDSQKFFQEAERCLIPGGKIFIVDQHKGIISEPVLKYIHHEPFVPEVKNWKFESQGPLSDANGAMAWIVFQRDIDKFKEEFKNLKFNTYKPHSPLHYWLAGGLKSWTLAPKWALPMIYLLDKFLISLSKNFGSFTDIEIQKI